MSYLLNIKYVLYSAVVCIFFVIYVFHFFSKKIRVLETVNANVNLLLHGYLEEYYSLKNSLEKIVELCNIERSKKNKLEEECEQLQFIVEDMNRERVEIMEHNPSLQDQSFEINSEHRSSKLLSLEVLKLWGNLELQIYEYTRTLKVKTNHLREVDRRFNNLIKEEGILKQRRSELECRIAELKPYKSVGDETVH